MTAPFPHHNRFRLGIVGLGQIGRQSHLPAALATTGVEVTVLVDSSLARARDAAAEFSIAPTITTDIVDALSLVDGVIIATPNHTHTATAVPCLRAGKAVLVEKPFASTTADAARIVEAAQAVGGTLGVAYCGRFRDDVRLLKHLLDRDRLGRVRRFFFQAGSVGGWAPVSGYNLNREQTGGGVLIVTGSHFLDRMLWFWGTPEAVTYADDSAGGPEANSRASFRFVQRGIEGVAIFSKTVSLPPTLVIETDIGIVQVEDRNGDIVFQPHGDGETEQVFRDRHPGTGARDIFQRQLEDFIQAHREGRQPQIDGPQGLERRRLIDRLYAARRPMDLDWDADAPSPIGGHS